MQREQLTGKLSLLQNSKKETELLIDSCLTMLIMKCDSFEPDPTRLETGIIKLNAEQLYENVEKLKDINSQIEKLKKELGVK